MDQKQYGKSLKWLHQFFMASTDTPHIPSLQEKRKEGMVRRSLAVEVTWPPIVQWKTMFFFVRDGILSVADYNSTLMGVVVVIVVNVVVVAFFCDGIP